MTNTNLTVRKGRCINFGNCPKADAKEVQEVNIGDDFVCSNCECESDLIEIPLKKSWMEEHGKKTAIAVAILLVLGFVAYMLFLKPAPPPPIVTITPQTSTIQVGETVKLIIKMEPEKKMVNWNWVSDNESVVTVINGTVTGIGAGSTTITASSGKGSKTISETATIKVEPAEPILVESISLDQNAITLNLKEKKTVTLMATILPDKADNKNVEWSSNNESVATVNNGIITAKKTGKTAITVKSVDGSNITVECKVTVDVPPPPPHCTITYSFGKYKGECKNGYPEGQGTMVYTKRVRIAKHDNKEHYAEAGYSLVGTWINGDISNGKLIDSNNNVVEVILAGARNSVYNLKNDN